MDTSYFFENEVSTYPERKKLKLKTVIITVVLLCRLQVYIDGYMRVQRKDNM